MTTPGGTGWLNPVVGGTSLRIPAINSPNFNLVNPTASPTPSWAILQSGLAYFFGLVLSGGTITGPDYIINTSGIFIYSGTPALGNLIGSWAGVAGVDSFGNVYPQGFNITQGAISGTTISGTDFIINTAGAFFYTSTPALGNLIGSIAGVAGTDTLGNAYQKGTFAYGPSGSYIGLTNDGSFASMQMFPPGPATHLTTNPNVAAKVNNAGAVNEQTFVVFSSGKESTRADAALQLFSVTADGTGAASAVIEFGGTIAATISQSQMTLNGIPLSISGQSLPNVSLTPTNSHITTPTQFFSSVLNGAAANEQILAVLSSGKESSHDDAALQLFSASADNTLNAVLTIEFGGTVFCTFTKTGMVLPGGSTPAAVSSSASVYGTTIGGLNVVDGADLQAYATQRRTLKVNSNTGLAASPSATTIFSTQVAVRTYLVWGEVLASISTAVQQLSINIAPPSGTGHASSILCRAAVLVAATDFNLNALTALGAAGSLAVGNIYICRFQTIINVTGAGTLNIQFAGTNANDITILQHSFCSFEIV